MDTDEQDDVPVKKKDKSLNGLFNRRSADKQEEEDAKKKKKKESTFSNTQCNIILGAVNVTLAIALITYLGSSDDLSFEMIVALTIGLLSLIVSTAALAFYSLCHMEPKKFRDALEIYIQDKRKKDPDFDRKLSGVWWVAQNKWMESEEAVDQELLEELNNPKNLRRSNTPKSTKTNSGTETPQKTDRGVDDDDEVLVDDGDIYELIDKPEPVNDKRLPVTDTKEGRETEAPGLEMTEIETKSRTPGNDTKRVPANVSSGGKKVEDSDEEMTPRSILASKKRKENRRRNHNKSVTFSREDQENDLFGDFEALEALEEDTTVRSDDLLPSDDSDITEEQVNFYDELFKKYLTMSFRKWKQPLIGAYPDGTVLATLEESALESIIPNKRPIRTRIIKEAKKLVKILEEQATQCRTEHQYGDSFLGPPEDISDEDDDENFQNRHGLKE